MAITRRTQIAHSSNYGSKRNTNTIKYIVIHYTGNDGDSDQNNAKYFQGKNRGASAHYFVDDDSITQSVKDNYVAWHCGGDKYYHAKCRNSNSIGVEMCDTVRDGTYNLSAKTRANVVVLVKELMKKYNIPIDNVIRHYDVTHKKCPAYFVSNSAEWKKFKAELTGKAAASTYKPTVKEWQLAAISDGYKFPIYGADGSWGSECVAVAQKAIVKKRLIYTNKNLTKIVQKVVGVEADGKCGSATVEAIKTYQNSKGLTADGVVGLNTWKKILNVK